MDLRIEPVRSVTGAFRVIIAFEMTDNIRASGKSFFVPKVDGSGNLGEEQAIKAFEDIRVIAEKQHGRKIESYKIHRLRFKHDNQDFTAEVGEISSSLLVRL